MFAKTSAPVLVARAVAPCSAQTSDRLGRADRAAEQVIARLGSEGPTESGVCEFTDAAQNGYRFPSASS